MQRVLYITRSRLSFSRAYARNIIKTAEYLNREDEITVRVFCSAAETKTAEEIFSAKEVFFPYELDVSRRKRSLLWEIFSKRNNFDILYFRDPTLWHIAWLVKKWWGKRIIFEAHGSEEWGTKAPWKKSVALADGLVFMTRKLEEYYNAIAPFCVTHCNGNDEEQKKARDADMLAIRDSLNLPREKTLVGVAGSFQWDSRELLLSMLPLLPTVVALVLVGIKESEVAAVKKEAHALGVEGRVHIIPRVPAKGVFPYLLAVDMPGSLSSKLYEYLAAGKPIITSPGGANDEVIIHGKNGVIIDPPTPENFAHAVEGILEDAAFGDALSHYAAESAKQYTWGARARCIADVIRKI
jgi:glycosyltransferase involved in cell wall biosynthesis